MKEFIKYLFTLKNLEKLIIETLSWLIALSVVSLLLSPFGFFDLKTKKRIEPKIIVNKSDTTFIYYK